MIFHKLHCSLAFYAMHVLLCLPSWVFFLEWMIRRQWSVHLMRQLLLRPEHTTHFSSAQRKAAVATWFLGICQILNFEPNSYHCSGGTRYAGEYGTFSGSCLLFLNIISLWPLPAEQDELKRVALPNGHNANSKSGSPWPHACGVRQQCTPHMGLNSVRRTLSQSLPPKLHVQGSLLSMFTRRFCVY